MILLLLLLLLRFFYKFVWRSAYRLMPEASHSLSPIRYEFHSADLVYINQSKRTISFFISSTIITNSLTALCRNGGRAGKLSVEIYRVIGFVMSSEWSDRGLWQDGSWQTQSALSSHFAQFRLQQTTLFPFFYLLFSSYLNFKFLSHFLFDCAYVFQCVYVFVCVCVHVCGKYPNSCMSSLHRNSELRVGLLVCWRGGKHQKMIPFGRVFFPFNPIFHSP